MSGGPNAESGHAPEPVDPADVVEQIARRDHAAFVRFANIGGWIGRDLLTDWDDMPEAYRKSRLATVRGLLEARVYKAGPAVTGRVE